jgi:tetratricopeptide (TPR) repeat protein
MSRPRFIGLLLVLLTLAVYLPVRQHGFAAIDDTDYVTENRVVQSGLTWVGVRWAFVNLAAGFWQPLTWLSHMLDCEWFGLNPAGHHLVNLLWHLVNTVLLLAVLRRMTGSLWRSAMVAALFALHPLHVESVAWVAERKDVLSAFFWLLTMLCYQRYVEATGLQSGKAKGYYAATCLCFVGGLMSKTMVVTLPVVLLLLDWWPLKRFTINNLRLAGRRLILEKLPLLAAGFISVLLTLRGERLVGALPSAADFPIGGRLGNAALSYVWYLQKMFWPDGLAVFYPYPKTFSALAVGGSVVILLLITILAIRAARTRPQLAVGWFWYVVTLLPVIGLVQIGTHARADRYTYLPLVGVFLALVWGAAELLARWRLPRWAVGTLAGLVLGACASATGHQLQYWRDDETLFAHALAVTADNPLAHVNYGVVLEQEELTEEAMRHYREALRLNPRQVQAHNNLASLLDQAGAADEALGHYREALRLNPAAPLAHLNLGALLAKLGQSDEAMQHYAEAARLLPGDPRPHYLMGKAVLRQNQSAAAIAHFRDALRCDENDFQTLTFLARVLASDENPQVRHGAEAVDLAERANALTGGSQPFVLDALAMACAEQGRFNDAQRIVRKAIDLATAASMTNTSGMKERLQLYQSSQPYRESKSYRTDN